MTNRKVAIAKNLLFVPRCMALILMGALAIESASALEITASCKSLRGKMHRLQQAQFNLKSGDKTIFQLNQEHDQLVAEYAITKSIIDLKKDFSEHRAKLYGQPLENLKSSIADIEDGRFVAGKMAALESFIVELKSSPELEGTIKKLRADKSADPTSEQVIMELAASKCSSSDTAPAFCQVLQDEEERATGFRKIASFFTGTEQRPIKRTLSEFAKTFQVIGSSASTSEVPAQKLTQFEALLKEGEGFDPQQYYGEMEQILSLVKGHSETISKDVLAYEECSAKAQAAGNTKDIANCPILSDTTKQRESELLQIINNQLSNPEFASKHRISLEKLRGDLLKATSSRDAASKAKSALAGQDEDGRASFNEILKKGVENIECVYSSILKRNLGKASVEDYFKEGAKATEDSNVGLANLKVKLEQYAPACSNVFNEVGNTEELKSIGPEASACLASLSSEQEARLQADSDALKAKIDAVKTQIDTVKNSQNYQDIEALKAFNARSYVENGDCQNEGGDSLIINACEKSGIDVGFNTITRLTDAAGQIITEYQASEVGEIESLEGRREYATRLENICKRESFIKMQLGVCNDVHLYHENQHAQTRAERNRDLIENHDVTYDTKTKKRVVRERKSVVAHPIVLEAATKSILGVGGAIIQGRNAYDASLLDGTQRLNMAWNNYYLNQYYYYNSPVLSGNWALGGYPFSMTNNSSLASTSAYYNIQ